MRSSFFLFMSPLFLVPLYDLIFYIPSSIWGPYKDLSDFFPLYLLIQSTLCIFLLYLLSIKNFTLKVNVSNYEDSGIGKFGYCCIFLVCVFLFLYLFHSVFSDFNFIKIFTNSARFYAKSKIGTAWVFFLYQFFLFLMLYDMYKSGVKKYRVVIFFLCVLIIALTGGRSSIISYMIFLVYIAIVVHGVIVPKKIVLTLVMFIFLIFSGNALLRSTVENSSEASVFSYLESDAFLLDFDNSFVLQDAIDYNYENGVSYLIFLEDLVYSFIPRAVYPNKPVSTAETRLVYSELLSDGRTTNYTFGIYGNAYLNFGYIGFLLATIVTIVVGFKYHNVFNRVHLRRTKDFFYIYFFMMFILVLRGGYFNIRIFMSFIVIFLSVCTYKAFIYLRFKV